MGRIVDSLIDDADPDFEEVFKLLGQRRGFRETGLDGATIKGARLNRYLAALLPAAIGILAAVLVARDLSGLR